AGAGAPRSGRHRNAASANPHSKLIAGTLNYALLAIDGATCTLTAKRPDGRVIDSVTFRARKP
ncbi:MAG: hypothetical protein ACYS5V_07285, partial [Planctomycetota bacterium]